MFKRRENSPQELNFGNTWHYLIVKKKKKKKDLKKKRLILYLKEECNSHHPLFSYFQEYKIYNNKISSNNKIFF